MSNTADGTILFIGDSITDCGRRAGNAPLGDGYVRMVSEFFTIRQPRRLIRFINKGVGGQTIVELQERWTDDVLHQAPDTLVLMVGINDLCRTVVQAPNPVPPDRYRALYDELMARTRRDLPACRIVLMDPFYITRESAHTSIRHTVFTRINDYITVVHDMARQYGTDRVRTHQVFQDLIRYRQPDEFCPEPVHPNHTGHLVLAEAAYQALTAKPVRRGGRKTRTS